MSQEDVGRRAVAVILTLLSAIAIVYSFVESTHRPFLDVTDVSDTPLLLQWVDFIALFVALLAGVQLLSPELCCDADEISLKRERSCVSIMLVFSAICFSITSRVRHINVSTAHIESTVCGRKDTPLACPTQRVNTSDSYTLWLRANEPTCWLNTSLDTTFTWGEELKDAVFLNTDDFSLKQTYEEFPQFAECYLFGCSELCNQEERHYHMRMLAFETVVTFSLVALIAFVLCSRRSHKKVYNRFEYV